MRPWRGSAPQTPPPNKSTLRPPYLANYPGRGMGAFGSIGVGYHFLYRGGGIGVKAGWGAVLGLATRAAQIGGEGPTGESAGAGGRGQEAEALHAGPSL